MMLRKIGLIFLLVFGFSLTLMAQRSLPKNIPGFDKKVFRFGSFGWSGGAQKHFDQMTEKLKWDCLEPLEFQGGPTDENLDKGFEMGKKFAQEIKKIPKKL